MPIVSIVMPVYNKSAYLADTIKSVLEQTFSDFELILVNDGSTDLSLQIAMNFAQMDTRIRVLNISNGGVSRARNVGLDHIRGTYITFMDADDKIHPSYIENLYTLLQGNSADLAISGIMKYQGNTVCGEMVSRYNGLISLDMILHDFASEQRRCGIYGSCVAKMFRRELISDIRFDENLALAEDFDFYLKLYAKVKNIVFDQKKHYYYLQEAENSSVQIADDKIDYHSQLQISLRYRNFLSKKNCYNNRNKEIVDSQISNFLYLSLYYCPDKQFAYRFKELYALFRTEGLKLQPHGLEQSIVLGLFKQNACTLLSATLKLFHSFRKFIRRLRNG